MFNRRRIVTMDAPIGWERRSIFRVGGRVEDNLRTATEAAPLDSPDICLKKPIYRALLDIHDIK